MRNGNIYSQLLELLRAEEAPQSGCLFGTLTGVAPLSVRVGGREVSQGLFYPREKVFRVEQIGQELALLPCENGLLILFEVEGGTT